MGRLSVTRAARNSATLASIAAVISDRDGVVIKHVPYIANPADVELLPGAAEAIRLINAHGIPFIIVTNQSGIGRGYYSLNDYERVKLRIDELLRARGAHVNETYYCPHAPHELCECRKPGPALFQRALAASGLDAPRAVFVGDRYSDLRAPRDLGGRIYLVPSPVTPAAEADAARRDGYAAASLLQVVSRVLTDRS